MVPACTGWFMIFCLWSRRLDFSQTMNGPTFFFWDITVLYNLQPCWTSLRLCSREVHYAKNSEGKAVCLSQPWEAVKFTAHVIFLTQIKYRSWKLKLIQLSPPLLHLVHCHTIFTTMYHNLLPFFTSLSTVFCWKCLHYYVYYFS